MPDKHPVTNRWLDPVVNRVRLPAPSRDVITTNCFVHGMQLVTLPPAGEFTFGGTTFDTGAGLNRSPAGGGPLDNLDGALRCPGNQLSKSFQ